MRHSLFEKNQLQYSQPVAMYTRDTFKPSVTPSFGSALDPKFGACCITYSVGSSDSDNQPMLNARLGKLFVYYQPEVVKLISSFFTLEDNKVSFHVLISLFIYSA